MKQIDLVLEFNGVTERGEAYVNLYSDKPPTEAASFLFRNNRGDATIYYFKDGSKCYHWTRSGNRVALDQFGYVAGVKTP